MRFTNPLFHFFDRIYSPFLHLGSNLQSLFLLYMRAVWGHQLFMAGMNKWADIDGVISFFTSLAIKAPVFNAYLVASCETICGISLFLGFASRIAAIPTAIIMITALSTAHAPALSDFKFLFHPDLLVKEAPYPYLITALVVFAFGPGRVSIDAWLKRWLSRQPKY